jgi:NAD(P)-dependent dehydrogenase (short-subunit alcohol dehydrogenase family)
MTPPEPDAQLLRRALLPLRGRVALVTGVSRRTGIGYAIARQLAALGASLSCTITRRTIATSPGVKIQVAPKLLPAV